MSPNPLLIILGPTASGKTRLATSIAAKFNAEIISADSRQVFRGMDIGTGKDLNDYIVDEKPIPYHLIDIKDAGEKYHVNLFKEDFYQCFQDITLRKRLPILCGGTGMYIHSILQNHELTAIPINESLRLNYQSFAKEELQNVLNSYDENLRLNADFSSSKRLIRAIEIAEYLKFNKLNKIQRPSIEPLIIGLQSDILTRRSSILARLNFRLKNGLVEEVASLMAKGVDADILTFYGLEYKYVTAYLMGAFNLEELREKLGIAICQFAKRQMTFFRKMEKDGVQMNWLNVDQGFDKLKSEAIQLINANFELK